jgi:hypothetical protein
MPRRQKPIASGSRSKALSVTATPSVNNARLAVILLVVNAI